MPLLWLSIAFLVGIVAAKPWSLSWQTWTVISGVTIIFLYLEQKYLNKTPGWKRLRSLVPLPVAVILLFFVLGGIRYSIETPDFSASDLAFYNDSGTYTLTGVVSAPPDRREYALYLEIKMLEIEDIDESDPQRIVKRISGSARVAFPASADWNYGDVLQFTGRPQTPSEDKDFSYKEYLSRQKIHTVLYFPQHTERVGQGELSSFRLFLETIRRKAWVTIFSQMPQPESGLLAGILLGLDNDLPEYLETAYQKTGTAHIIAISGFNMALLAGIFTALFSRVSNRYWAAGLTLCAVTVYTVFVGGSPSVVRAAIMSVMALGAHLIGRRQAGMNALGFTAGLMCLINPMLIEDVSFQLSFTAALGLVAFGNPMSDWVKQHFEKHLPEEKVEPVTKPILDYLLLTLAAQVTTLPVIVYHFRRVSINSLLANPLILPVQPPILVLGAFSVITGAFLPGVGKVIALIPWMLMRYTNWVVEGFSKMKTASISIHPQMSIWIMVVLFLFVLLFLGRNYFKKLFGKWSVWILFLLVVSAAAAWSIIRHLPDGNLHLDIAPAGSETVLMVRDPDGKVFVLNPGENVNDLCAEIGRVLSPWDYAIDQVWITNRISASHLKLLSERIPISGALITSNVYLSGADQQPVQIPDAITGVKMQPGGSLHYPSGLQVFAAETSIDHAALYLTYGETRILIPNGVDFARIREAAPEILESPTILILQEADIHYIPPRVWQNLEPQTILWYSRTIPPEAGWLGLDSGNRVSIISNGETFIIQ